MLKTSQNCVLCRADARQSVPRSTNDQQASCTATSPPQTVPLSESNTLWGGCLGCYHQQHCCRQQITLSWVGREGHAEFAALCARKFALKQQTRSASSSTKVESCDFHLISDVVHYGCFIIACVQRDKSCESMFQCWRKTCASSRTVDPALFSQLPA